MFKKFIQGLVFGAGFAIAFLGIIAGTWYFFSQPQIIGNTSHTISVPPSLDNTPKYLGSSGIYSSGFMDGKRSVLIEGPGQIIGSATSNKLPVKGLRLRLALEGSAYTQWAVTNEKGEYAISVPYGEYQIAGFELDRQSANFVLPNKILHPHQHHSSQKFLVADNSHGRGIHFEFVDPIQPLSKGAKFRSTEEVIVQWKPHPGAISYSIQVYEKNTPEEFNGKNQLFPWSERPQVSAPEFNLEKLGVELKPGKFYAVIVQARGPEGNILSENYRAHDGYHFEVTE